LLPLDLGHTQSVTIASRHGILSQKNESASARIRETRLSRNFQKQPLHDSNLGKTNIKHHKIRCRFVLDIGPGTMESTVECYSTLGQ